MKYLTVILFLFVLGNASMNAQTPPSPPAQKLKVLVKPAKPFAFEQNGVLTGYSVDLWKRVAERAKVDFEASMVPTVSELINAVEKGEADAGVGALSITAEREQRIDFSYPFYESGLSILVNVQGKSSVFSAVSSVAGDVLAMIGILLLALLLNAHAIWLFERRRNPESFPESYVAGVWEATWWSVCTLITGGCENKSPVGVGGRLFAIVWMLGGIGLVSLVTAKMASIMTVQTLAGDIRGLRDLEGKKIGTLKETAASRYLVSKGMETLTFGNLDEAAAALTSGAVRAVVYDEPILRFYLAEHPNAKMQLTGETFEKQGYGFALRHQSPLRKTINRALLELSEEGAFNELKIKWFSPAP